MRMGKFDLEAFQQMAAEWPGLEGMDLAKEVSREQLEAWSGGKWVLGGGLSRLAGGPVLLKSSPPLEERPHVVAIDYGAKRNIFRNLVEAGARVTILPAGGRRRGDGAQARRILPLQRAGRSGGDRRICDPGDPRHARQRQALVRHLPWPPTAGAQQSAARPPRCSRATAAPTTRSSASPTGAVEITSMNHGFAVERQGLPNNVRETHVSLFDDSNCGIELTDRPAFSVRYHPEASPGPQDSFYLFEKFVGMMR